MNHAAQDAPILKAQIVRIKMAQADLSRRQPFTDDDYRNLLHREFGATSCKQLTRVQADDLIRHLVRLGARPRVTPAREAKLKPKPPQAPTDPDAPIKETQQHVITCLFGFLGWTQAGQIGFTRKIVKQPWAQTHKHGQHLIYALVAIAAPKLLTALEEMDHSLLTRWEYQFFANAHAELKAYVESKGTRGRRTMPAVSMTKLFEILNKY